MEKAHIEIDVTNKTLVASVVTTDATPIGAIEDSNVHRTFQTKCPYNKPMKRLP